MMLTGKAIMKRFKIQDIKLRGLTGNNDITRVQYNNSFR